MQPMHFGNGKNRGVTWRDVSRLSDSTARHARHTSETRTTRVQGRRHSVDWGGHVHPTFIRRCSWDWCKFRAQKTKLVHDSITASSSSAMLEKARLDTLVTTRSTLVTTGATRTTRRTCSCCVVSRRNEQSGIWALTSIMTRITNIANFPNVLSDWRYSASNTAILCVQSKPRSSSVAGADIVDRLPGQEGAEVGGNAQERRLGQAIITRPVAHCRHTLQILTWKTTG